MKIKPIAVVYGICAALAVLYVTKPATKPESDGKFEMRDTHATGFTSIHKVHVAKDGTKYQLVEAEGKWGVQKLDSSEYIHVKDTCEEAKKMLRFLLDYESDYESLVEQQKAIKKLQWKVSDCNEEPLK